MSKSSERYRLLFSRFSAGVIAFTLVASQLAYASFPGELPGVEFDHWESSIFQRCCLDEPRPSATALTRLWQQSKADPAHFFDVVTERFACRYTSPEAYLALARALLEFRPADRSRELMHLLALMSDSTLYAYHHLFPKAESLFEIVNPNTARKVKCPLVPWGAPVCTGDLVLSKFEAFSASLFLLRSRFEYSFSHAAIAVREKKTEFLQLIETDVFASGLFYPTDRPPATKLSVYRLKTDVKLPAAAVKKLVGEKLQFNFTLEPKCEKGQYFCSEMLYCAFPKDERNPFPQKNWAAPDSDGVDFLKDLGGKLYSGPIPFPADLELNPKYDWVMHQVFTDQLFKTRVQYAATESFIELMKGDLSLRARYLASLTRIGKQNLKDIPDAELLALGRKGWKIEHFVNYLKKNGPPELRLNEVLFYFHFQSFVLPVIEDGFKNEAQEAPVMLSQLVRKITPLMREQLEKLIRS